MKYYAGIDIGGTNTVLGIIDDNGHVVETMEFSTKSYSSPETFVEAIGDEINKRKDQYKLNGLGIGAPNGNYYTGSIEFAPNLPWKGKIELSVLFTKKTGLICKVSNDANAAAIGEMK